MEFLIKRKAHIALALAAIAILVAALAISISKKSYTAAPVAPTGAADPFASLNLEAKAAYALDLSNGKVLFDKNGSEVLPLASITKLISAIVAEKYLPPETNIPITTGDSDGLDPGEIWSFKNLLDFTLVVSSNDGIDSIASVAGAVIASSSASDPESVFVEEMNKTTKTLGISDMYFYDPSGLDMSTTTSGGYGSAKDVASIVGYILKNNPSILSATTNEKITVSSNLVSHTAENTDEAIPYIPSIVGSKTGYTDLAGGNLAVILDVGLMHPVALVVLGSSYDGRFTDMEALARVTIQSLSQK